MRCAACRDDRPTQVQQQVKRVNTRVNGWTKDNDPAVFQPDRGGGAGNRTRKNVKLARIRARSRAQTEATRVDVSPRLPVAFGPDYLESARIVEEALASAIEGAAKAGRWDVVAQLASELEAHRIATSGTVDRRR
jgi:hypothetical protein